MTNPDYTYIDRTGDFRGRIIKYRALEGKSGSHSVGIGLTIRITGIWDEETQAWDDTWEQYQQIAEGAVWPVKRDGTINDNQVRSLVECAGWDRQMASVVDNRWQPTPVAFNVVEESYDGNTTLKIGFLNAYDDAPGNRGMSADTARAFDHKYGSQMRAIGGNAARNAVTPTDKPASPPSAKKSNVPPPNDIPF